MNDVEQRLRDAAAEVRQVAGRAVIPPLATPRHPYRRGLLAFAAAFVVVIVVIGVIPLLSGIRHGDPLGPLPPTGPLETPTTPDTTVTEPSLDCSAAGMDRPGPVEGIPAAVAVTREAIANAALRCDFAALEELGGPDLVTSFGGGGVDNLEMWEAQGEEPLAILIRVLDMSHGVIELPDDMSIYVWPLAHAYDTWEEIPQDAVSELLTIYTEEDLDRFAEFGGYVGWRLGISETGQWLFFVAGD